MKSSQVLRLAKVLGPLAIMASAVSQEYGSGINYVAIDSLSAYPNVGNLVPLAMFITGLILIPKVYMFQRYSRVENSSGGEYAWMSRSVSPMIGFIVQFIWWIGVTAAMGFIAYTIGDTLASALVLMGISSGSWFATLYGHIVIGIIAIWTVFLLHYSGVKNYGMFVIVLFGVIILSAVINIYFGLTTSAATFSSLLSSNVFHGNTPSSIIPGFTLGGFLGTVTLFIFAYGGLSGAPMLGGESKNAKKNMPRGIIYAWLTAIILFTSVAYAIFHVAHANLIIGIINSKHSYYATVPGIIGLVTPRIVGIFISIIITIILAKTLAPGMMVSSRTMFAFSEDKIFPQGIKHTNRYKAPDVAILITAVLASLFLIDTSVIGITVIVLRSISILIVIAVLGIGVIKIKLKKEKKDWENVVSGTAMIIAAIAGIIVAAIMIPSVIYTPGVSIYLQPTFQLFVSAIAGYLIFIVARKAYDADLDSYIRSKLLEE